MEIPEELAYSKDHEWARVEGDRARVGITDYAQDALGDVVFVQPPALGAELEAGDVMGEVESTKSVSDLFAPFAGTVVEVNPALTDVPELVNSDPYGEGWICIIELTKPDALGDLLDAAAYRSLVED